MVCAFVRACVCVCVCVCVCATVVDKVTVDRALSVGAAERGLVPAASLQGKMPHH